LECKQPIKLNDIDISRMLFKVDLETWILIVPLRTSLLAMRLLDIVAKRASFASKYIKTMLMQQTIVTD